MSKRLYKSGSRWAFWRWTFTPSGYLTRLFLVHTPWGGIMLHWINGPDPEPDPHNHPVDFVSLLLRGWYREIRREYNVPSKFGPLNVQYSRPVKRYNYIRAEKDIHQIYMVSPGGALTLVFYGPKRCEWGFFCNDGFMYWKDYNRKYKKCP